MALQGHKMLATIILWLFVILFFIVASIKRKKIKILPSILVTLTVTFFALLSPYGKVILTIGSLKITLDSLNLGLKRSGILVGMVFLSQIIISPNIKLPGKAGKFLKQVFYWLKKLTEVRIKFKPKMLIETLDNRLCEIWEEEQKYGD